MNCEKYKPTYILIAITTAVYIYTSIAGGNWLNTSDNMIFTYGQVNLLVFPRRLLAAFHINIYTRFNSAPCRQHAFPIHFRLKGRRNVFAARVLRNLLYRRLSRQRSFLSVWATVYFGWSFRRNFLACSAHA